MASSDPQITNRIKHLSALRNQGEGKGEATEGKGTPNKNGDVFGESVLWAAYRGFKKLQTMQQFHQEYQLQRHQSWTWNSTFVDSHDEVAEIFLDADGNIEEPLVRGVAFDLCRIDRWYMPDCIPAIISRVDISHCKKPVGLDKKKIITVLYADGKYIHLDPEWLRAVKRRTFYIEPEDSYYEAVEVHFIRRGIDHIREQNVIPGSQNWATFKPNEYKTNIAVFGTHGGGNPKSPIINQSRCDRAGGFATYTTAATTNKISSWTIGR